MRKLLLSIAAAGTVMAFSSPAAAQWHRPGYSAGARYQDDLQNLRVQMDNLQRSGRLNGREWRDLDNDLRGTQVMILRANRGGIQPWQARSIEQRINNIRYELRRYSDYDGNARWHNGRRY